MAALADDTLAVDAVATEAAPELAWSLADDDELDLPRSWRPAIRAAAGVFAACVAIAGGITAVDRQWFSELRAPAPAPAASQLPTESAPTPSPEPIAAAPSYSSAPAAEHLVPPVPTPPDPLTTSTPEQDALFFAGLTAAGIVVYDRSDAMDTGHYVCQARASGLSRTAIATMAVSRNPRLSPRDATNLVLVSINAYCPGY